MAKNIVAKPLNIADVINIITNDKFIIECKDGKVVVAKKVLAEQISVTRWKFMIELIIKYFKELIIVIISILMVIFWQLYQNKSKEFDSLNTEATVAKKLDIINSQLNEINLREKELYPRIESNIRDINNNIKESKNRLENIEKNQPKKESIYANFKNKNITQISEYLLNSGYPNTIIDNSKCK